MNDQIDDYQNYKSRSKGKNQAKVWHSKGANPSSNNDHTKNAKRGHSRAKRHDRKNSCKADQIDRDVKRLPKRITNKLNW